MDERNQARKVSLMWTIVDLVFLIVIGVLMVNYIHAGKTNGKNAAFEKVKAVATAVAERVNIVTDEEINMASAIIEYAQKENLELGSEATRIYAETLKNNTVIDHFIFCDGERAICDEKGMPCEGFDVSFSAKSPGEELFISDTTPYGNGYYLIARVGDYKNKYVLSLVSLDNLDDLFKTEGYEEVSFLAIVKHSGIKLATFSRYIDKDSGFLTVENVVDTIGDNLIGIEKNSFVNSVSKGTSSTVSVKIGDESRTVAVVGLENTDWCLVFGVQQAYVERMIKSIVNQVRGAVYKLFAATAIFSIFVVVTVVFGTARNREKSRMLENKADTDLLTDLYNKGATERKIQDYIDENPNGRGLIFVLDIDNFKKINDTMGHAFGDTLLKTLGKEIRSEFRATDVIGRTGGDEFMVFLKDVTDNVIVEREANRITRFFQEFKAGGDYVKYSATASIGAAIYPDDAKTFKDLYVAADQALYRAKKRGKNQLVFYNESEKK